MRRTLTPAAAGGQTNRSLEWVRVSGWSWAQRSHAGSYSVIVSNDFGSITSVVATLVITGAVTQVVPPVMNISREGSYLLVSWSDPAFAYHLEESTEITGPWQPVPSPPLHQ